MIFSVFMKAGVVLTGLYTEDLTWKPKQIYSKSDQKISVVKNTCFAYMDLPYLYHIEICLLLHCFYVCVPMKTLPWRLFPPEGLLFH